MKTTFLALFAFILCVACSTEEDVSQETNGLVNSPTILESLTTIEGVIPDPECYHIQFDPSIYTAETIPSVKSFHYQNHEWFAAPEQPQFYPFQQIWCKGLPLPPNGEEEETDPPIGVTITPLGGYGG